MVPGNYTRVAEAFNSMLRTDYISLNDVDKLRFLVEYYVDYFGYLPQILAESDQLVVGRRGTGKTTLLYRALVECMRSWGDIPKCLTKPRALGIYVDLSKCQSLDASAGENFEQLEHAFASEVCDAITEQMTRLWPELSEEPSLFAKLFRAAESKNVHTVRVLLARFAELLKTGVPRIVDYSEPALFKESQKTITSRSRGARAGIKVKDANLQADLSRTIEETNAYERETTTRTTYRLMLADILRLLGELKEEANLSAIYLFIDEYSALSESLQRRFTTLLRKILGSHAGVFVKLCAITDNYTLGSSIILQRDLFEISLDLDAYVERSGSLNDAMEGLCDQVESILSSRLRAYNCPSPNELFDIPDTEVWVLLSRSAMGVPRTLGIVLQQAWSRAQQSQLNHIRRRDISYGIQYASKAYLNQMMGAAKGGMAIPVVVVDIWNALLERAQIERSKARGSEASHFMVMPKHEYMLKYLNMFFLVHLLTTGRTTKKQKISRSLYCFEYGTCEEHRLGFSSDKNVIRQQRFAYDDVLAPFEKFFNPTTERTYRCPFPGCNKTFKESELMIAGTFLTFCPFHKADLVLENVQTIDYSYTEEEIKIIGAIRSATKADRKLARQIADDVGCYVQKVAKFGEKLEREGLAQREKELTEEKFIYFGESS